MLFPGRVEANSVSNPVVVWPHHKAVDSTYFCPSLTCLSDDLLVRRASSFRHVWLVTEVATERTWLMQANRPSCPHCESPLCEVADEPENAVATAERVFVEHLLADSPASTESTLERIDHLPFM